MAYSDKVRGIYEAQLQGIRDAGIFKQERYIHSPQAADIEVEFPAGAPLKKVINMCANNYLGLSSHPDVVRAAHEGLDSRGYGMSSVRFICGTQDIHRELERRLTGVPGDRGHAPLPLVHGRQRRRLRGHPDQGRRHDLGPARPRLARRRHPPLQRHARHLQALRHGPPREQAPASRRQAAQGRHHRRRLLDGRRHGQARRDGRPLREVRRHAPRRRLPRLGLHRQDRPRDARELRRHGQDRHHHDDLRQGPRRGVRRLCLRPEGARRDVPPEGPAVPVLEHHRAGRRGRRPQGHGDPLQRAPSVGTSSRETPPTGGRA